MFRLGEEWLGLVTRCLAEVAPLQPIHSLPHQRSRALLGVANVRGALVACLSLVELLGLDATTGVVSGARVMPRMLIIAAHGGPVVVPVDEVDGIHAIDERTLSAASSSGSQTAGRYTRGVLQFRGRSLRWLDEEQLLSAVTHRCSNSSVWRPKRRLKCSALACWHSSATRLRPINWKPACVQRTRSRAPRGLSVWMPESAWRM